MTKDEYIKELKELYDLAKTKGQIELAFWIINRINIVESTTQLPLPEEDPCGVDNFRKQADEKVDK